MVYTQGGVVVALAAIGVLIGLRKRTPAQVWMIIWLVGIVEFSTLGLLEKTFPHVMEPLLKYDYPFSLAWHGPIIPYTLLGGLALVWLADRLGGARMDRVVGWLAPVAIALGVIGLVAGLRYFDQLIDTSKKHLSIYGAFSSSADVDALIWLRDNAPADARVLNHPGPHEADWAPVISERDSIYFRPQPFFRHTELADEEQDALRAFWQNPADEANAALLTEYGVSYVLVPQVFGNPASFEDMLRWRRPVPEAESYRAGTVSDASYLRLVYENDGAQIYEVIPSAPAP
jgi:hypothetical protein